MHDDLPSSAAPTSPGPGTGAKPPPHKISSKALFGGVRELIIDHEGRLYHLRITQNGKLILTA